MKIFTEIELNFLNYFFNTAEKQKRISGGKKYEFAIITSKDTDIISKLLDWFERESGENLKNRPNYLFLHSYNVGDYFELHNDMIERDYKHREYVLGFHINDDYEGGEYILYNPNSIIEKTAGVPYYFKADRPHEIKKITKGNRKSALIFIHSEDLIKVERSII